MPAAPLHKMRWWCWPILAAMFSGLAYWVYCQPYVLPFIVLIGVVLWFQTVFETRRRRQALAARQSETICDFARSFDRGTDTWIVRAVYEELCRFLSVDGRLFPLRKADHCEKDLKIDPEDLDDLAGDIAFRAGRSMEDTKSNPLYGKVKTVSDIVTFLEHQPRVADVEPSGAANVSHLPRQE